MLCWMLREWDCFCPPQPHPVKGSLATALGICQGWHRPSSLGCTFPETNVLLAQSLLLRILLWFAFYNWPFYFPFLCFVNSHIPWGMSFWGGLMSHLGIEHEAFLIAELVPWSVGHVDLVGLYKFCGASSGIYMPLSEDMSDGILLDHTGLCVYRALKHYSSEVS
jgi:hypothetical protein